MRIITIILILSVFLFCFIACNLRLMDIEDRYGDLQELYWKTKNGDIAVNKLNSKSAIIETDWHRINVKIDEKLIPIDEWLDPNNKNIYDIAIYRPDKKLKSLEKFNVKESELVLDLKVKY
jgi:hypothetical protein